MSLSEFSWAQISIGGQIKKDLIPELVELILKEQDLITPEGDTLDDIVPSINSILSYVDNDGHLTFESDEASSGKFGDLEQWLRDHDLSYSRTSEQTFEDGNPLLPETSYWCPGFEDIKIILNDMDGLHLVHVGEIEWVLKAVSSIGSIEDAPKFINHGNVHEKSYAAYILKLNIIDPIGYLQEHLKEYYAVPAFPPFEII